MRSREEIIENIERMFRKGEAYSDAEFDEHYLGVIQSPKFMLFGFTKEDLLVVKQFLMKHGLEVRDLLAVTLQDKRADL